MLKLIGVWLFCDAIFSLHNYWGREGLFEQGIRFIRLVCSVVIITRG